MSEQTVIGRYDDMSQTEEAIRSLDQGGFPLKQVSVIVQNLESEKKVDGFVTVADLVKKWAGIGAWVGALLGLLIGVAIIWIPGFGPLLVADRFGSVFVWFRSFGSFLPGSSPALPLLGLTLNPVALALLGGLEGAIAGAVGGALLGALVGWSSSKRRIIKYKETLRGGPYVVVAHGSAEQIAKAHEILQGPGADEPNLPAVAHA
jgi:uncharacterized membrane protein